MATKLVYTEVDFGYLEEYFWDDEEDTITVKVSVDPEIFVENNKKLQNNGTNGFSKSRDLRHIATLDSVTIMKLKKEFDIDVFNRDDDAKLKKWLRNPENKYYRTCSGKI